MNKIDVNTIWLKPVADFKTTIYGVKPKPVVFWDTCALLNIIRFIYREKGDFGQKYNSIKHVYDQILSGNIYSVTSEIVVKEWNDNIDKTLSGFKLSLEETTKYHSAGIIVSNLLNARSDHSEPLIGKGLEQHLFKLVKDIIDETYYMAYDKEIAYDALQRTSGKTPPAGVKEEFKDCAIWSTMVVFSKEMNTIDATKTKVFYTKNTEDFCERNSDPPIYLHALTSEAITIGFECCVNIEDVALKV